MNPEAMLEIITERLTCSDLNSFQTDFLLSIQRQLQVGKTLSDNQLTVLTKVIDQTAPVNFERWTLTEAEKIDLEIISNLTRSYSSYYLDNYNSVLKNALEHIRIIKLKLESNQKILIYEKKYFNTAMNHLKSRINKIKNPKFKKGDLCLFREKICVVIESVFVNKTGDLVCVVDFGGQHSEVLINNLKKIPQRRK